MSDDAWAAHYATGAGLRFWPCEELVRFVGDQRYGDVLEVGCGNGANLWFLGEHAASVVGVDSSPLARGLAGALLADRAAGRRGVQPRVYDGDARRLPFEAASFDLVVDCMVSQHLAWKDHEPAYREYRRVLRPGGALFLYHLDNRTDCDSRPGATRRDFAWLALFPDVELTCLPLAATLALCVEQAGFAGIERRGLLREYRSGDTASYAVIAARAA